MIYVAVASSFLLNIQSYVYKAGMAVLVTSQYEYNILHTQVLN